MFGMMLGVSLVTADDWILRYFASGSLGDITRLNYAKRLFAVPIAVLGQATGQASLPFFARLFGEKRMKEFADTDGAQPAGQLSVGTDSKLYGTTSAGGVNGRGTVFRIATDGTHDLLAEFTPALLGATRPWYEFGLLLELAGWDSAGEQLLADVDIAWRSSGSMPALALRSSDGVQWEPLLAVLDILVRWLEM